LRRSGREKAITIPKIYRAESLSEQKIPSSSKALHDKPKILQAIDRYSSCHLIAHKMSENFMQIPWQICLGFGHFA